MKGLVTLMSEAENNNIVTLFDEDNNAIDFEILDAVELDGKTYLALTEAHECSCECCEGECNCEDDEEECEFIVLRIDSEGENDVLVTVDDGVLVCK